jgi:hypothetical protein
LSWWGTRFLSKNINSDPFDAILEVLKASGFNPLMGLAYKVFDVGLVLGNKRLYVRCVDAGGSFWGWQKQITVEEETKPGVERDMAER